MTDQAKKNEENKRNKGVKNKMFKKEEKTEESVWKEVFHLSTRLTSLREECGAVQAVLATGFAGRKSN